MNEMKKSLIPVIITIAMLSACGGKQYNSPAPDAMRAADEARKNWAMENATEQSQAEIFTTDTSSATAMTDSVRSASGNEMKKLTTELTSNERK